MLQEPLRCAQGFAQGIAASAAACGLAFAAFPAAAQTPVPAGDEFQVNTYTTGEQRSVSLAMDADGDFVGVWNSSGGASGTDTSQRGVLGQRYASDGSAQGVEFQVNTNTVGDQFYPSVAMVDDGSFVVVWGNVPLFPPYPMSIQGQRFASDGSTQGPQFQVNSRAMIIQNSLNPSVATAADGAFVVVWPQPGAEGADTSGMSIQGRRFASNGSAQGAQFQVNSYTTGDQFVRGFAVAAAPDGDFFVVWNGAGSFGTDTSGHSVQGQRYASDGSAQGGQFQVNAYTTSHQGAATVSAAGDGTFIVVWQCSGSYGTDTDSGSVQGQRYASDGSAQGAQFQVNTYTTGGQSTPSVAAIAEGGFVVAWHSQGSFGTDTSYQSVQGQRFASSGIPLGAEFQVSSFTTGRQWIASVAAADGANFVVAWESAGSSGTDTSDVSIQGQRYSVAGATTVPALSASALLVLGATLISVAAYVLRRRS